MKLRCGICGHIWKEKDNKDLKGLPCPKCKKLEIGIMPKVNRLKEFYDKASLNIGRSLALIYYNFTKILSTFLFYYGQELLHFITLVIILSLITYMKNIVFVNDPLYVVSAVVLATLLIIKIRF